MPAHESGAGSGGPKSPRRALCRAPSTGLPDWHSHERPPPLRLPARERGAEGDREDKRPWSAEGATGKERGRKSYPGAKPLAGMRSHVLVTPARSHTPPSWPDSFRPSTAGCCRRREAADARDGSGHDGRRAPTHRGNETSCAYLLFDHWSTKASTTAKITNAAVMAVTARAAVAGTVLSQDQFREERMSAVRHAALRRIKSSPVRSAPIRPGAHQPVGDGDGIGGLQAVGMPAL